MPSGPSHHHTQAPRPAELCHFDFIPNLFPRRKFSRANIALVDKGIRLPLQPYLLPLEPHSVLSDIISSTLFLVHLSFGVDSVVQNKLQTDISLLGFLSPPLSIVVSLKCHRNLPLSLSPIDIPTSITANHSNNSTAPPRCMPLRP